MDRFPDLRDERVWMGLRSARRLETWVSRRWSGCRSERRWVDVGDDGFRGCCFRTKDAAQDSPGHQVDRVVGGQLFGYSGHPVPRAPDIGDLVAGLAVV